MQPLDPLNVPLQGCRLLEASAGTGKTYTLVLLFLRLLLERKLAVEQILVVTFTRAATGELRDRIRRRLREALDGSGQRTVDDPQLAALLDRIPRELGRRLLNDALVRMDEAAIYTIHGFCQRILQDHAFESGSSFEVELLEEESQLRQQVVEDFWRNRFYTASMEEAAWAADRWGDPAGLLKALGSAAFLPEAVILPEVDPARLGQLAEESRSLFADIQALWTTARSEVQAILEQDSCLLRNDKAYRLSDQVPQLLAAMDTLAVRPDAPFLLPKGIERMGAATMSSLLKKKCDQPPSHPFFALFDAFHASRQEYLGLHTIQALREARDFLHRELDARKRHQNRFGYDDLLTRLAAALERRRTGAQLAHRVGSRFPVALVDEFQDTDPVQYRLFSRIYRREGQTLFMIGDPKQAIYSFRGADIFAYIRARRETLPANRVTMATNYRSTPAMVGAVNTLFSRRSDAFVFTQDIAFHPVQAAAAPQASPLLLDGQAVPPFAGLLLDAGWLQHPKTANISKERAEQGAVAFCAETIACLLNKAKRGKAVLNGKNLVAGDIAILVRTHREADAMQQGLRRVGLNSVAYSQDSVFSTEEARQLMLALAALLDLADAARIRTCLATDLFGRSAEELHALHSNEQRWEAELATLLQYQRLWRDQGFLPMFQHLLAGEHVTRRLSARTGGERSLTNFLHLAELLQESPASQHGMAGLLRWLQQQILNPDSNAENQLIRLENDEQLIRIVTIHRVKGLEFPVVFLPFLWQSRSARDAQVLAFHHRETLQLTVDLGTGSKQHRQWAEEEHLAEELRLLYVAMTRSKSCCLFCWGRVSGIEQTALGYLLHQGLLPATGDSLRRELEQLNAHAEVIALHSCPDSFETVFAPASDAQADVLQPKVFHGTLPSGWSMTSYSRLIAGREGTADQDPEEPAAFQSWAGEDYADIFTFPRGPAAGTCLHTLLERLDFNRSAQDQQALVSEALEQGGIDQRWLPATARWLDNLLAVELPGSCRLNQLASRDRIDELGFLFPLDQVDLRRFNTILQGAGLAPLAAAGTLQGLMKGFIDLVFRHEGRYFVVDYKSNYLGPALSHYSQQALADCMASHQYHLQSLIYSLALHRFLQSRLADYRYETHFGGVYYLFLRAMHPDHPAGSGMYAACPAFGLVDQLDRCCRGGEDGR